MKKKVLCALLVGAMTASLFAGCGNSSDGGKEETTTSGTESGAAQTGDAVADMTEGYPTEIDMTEDPYEVAIQVVTLPGTDFSQYEEQMEEAIDEITLPAINCTVDLQFVWISEVSNTTSMAIAGDEKIDLVHVATVQTLSTMVGSEMLLDMNQDNLLQNRGSKLEELFADTMEAGNVDGQQLAVPALVYNANANGIIYNKDIADELGIEIPDKITFDELEDILYKVHEAKPDIYPYYSGNGEQNYLAWLQQYESFGTQSSYGIVQDSENPVVENLYATDMFKDYCVRMQKWTADGIQPGDPTDTSSAQDYYNAGKLFSVVATINPQQEVDWNQYDVTPGFTTMVDAIINNTGVTEYMWGIAANCERPDKAMDFLNFLYSNADVANILSYGLESVNYEMKDGSDTVIETNGTYIPMFFRGGNKNEMYIQSPADENFIEEEQEFESSADISPLCGYMFDDSQFQTESSVIYSTILEYLPRLQNGMCASEEETLALIDEFNEALDAAGINDVIAANQEQLDAYLAAH